MRALTIAGILYGVLGLFVAGMFEYSLVRYRTQLEAAGVVSPSLGRRIAHFAQRALLWPVAVWATTASYRSAGERSRQTRRAMDRSATRHTQRKGKQ